MTDRDMTRVEADEPGVRTEVMAPLTTPPSIPPSGASDPGDPHDDGPAYLRMAAWSLLALAIFALVVGAFLMVYHHRQDELARHREQCRQSMTTLEDKAATYRALLEGDGAEAGLVADGDVADASVIARLDEELSADAPGVVNCEAASVEQFEERVRVIGERGAWYETHTRSLRDAVDRVNDSKARKELDDAVAALTQTAREADTLLGLTRGAVADTSTWDALSDLTRRAGTLTSDAGRTDLARVVALERELRESMDRVAASRDQKTADDARRAQEQREAAAKRAAQEKEETRREASSHARDSGHDDDHDD